MNITGNCHCGAISFTALIDPGKVIACHCADCQQFSGAPFRAVIPVPADQVQLKGTPQLYVKTAQSGNKRAQAFCGTCGTQLYATEPDQPKMINIRLGCVTERAQLPPTRQIWASSAMAWVHTLEAVPAHAQGPASALFSRP